MSLSRDAPGMAGGRAIRPQNMAAFASLPSDTTGIVTFERYLWQAKIAIRSWLDVLTGTGSIAVVCEHVEDIAIVEADAFRFAQLKTRDKGSWSLAKVLESGHAIHRLAASYELARQAGIVELSKFEVWLEGPPSEQKATTDFFADPTCASAEIKKKIRAFGLSGSKITDFLRRLTIHCHLPARPSVDAVNIRFIGAIWPGHSMEQIERLYDSLLQTVTAAQSASASPLHVRAAMLAARSAPAAVDLWQPIASQALTLPQLRALCPPLAADTDQDLVARAAVGEATMLELKLVRAGASESTVRGALLARADADVAATLARASGIMTSEGEMALDARLLAAASSIAALAAATGTGVQRPAEYVYHTMMSNVANTAAVDPQGVLSRDHRLLVGHLCAVSDQCRYDWGAS